MNARQGKYWNKAISDMKERLFEPILWFPFPALIAFGLVIILRGHLLTGLNPRLGAKVDVIPLSTESHPDGGIWLGIFAEGESIFVVTSDRKRFGWSQKSQNMKDLDPLVSYLSNRVQEHAYSTAIKLENSVVETTAVLAIDQKIKFVHLRPVIYALAKARISKYGFETRILRN